MAMRVEKTQSIDHLGIVSAIVFNLKIVEEIDSRIPVTDKSHVSMGQRVLAMILNGLGFTNERLYLVPQFFENKPLDILIGPGVEAWHLNDDCLGRALDAIYEYGTTKLFSEIAFAIAIARNLSGMFSHLDTTTLSLFGSYDTDNIDKTDVEPVSTPASNLTPLSKSIRDSLADPDVSKKPVVITHGHSKDHRPDLKQVVLSMVTTGPAGIPIFMEVLDGNNSDKVSFHNTINKVSAIRKELSLAPIFKWVADSALYTKDKLLNHNNKLIWITRVPATLANVKSLTQMPDENFEWVEIDSGYRFTSLCSTYGGIRQRWLLIFSKQAYDREISTFEKKLSDQEKSIQNELWHFGNRGFSCIEDAYAALIELTSKWKFHYLHDIKINEILHFEGKGRPKKDRLPTSVEYKIACTISRNELAIQLMRNTKGRFILATNDMEMNEKDMYTMSDIDVFNEYKAQSQVERGFRFIKDPWFMVDSVFLKKPERIEALMMIMTLTLLVYNIGEYELREKLKNNNDTVPNQVGKQVKNPTLRWVFQLMQGIHVVYISTTHIEYSAEKVVTNITEGIEKIIRYFGLYAINIYMLPNTAP